MSHGESDRVLIKTLVYVYLRGKLSSVTKRRWRRKINLNLIRSWYINSYHSTYQLINLLIALLFTIYTYINKYKIKLD